MPRPSLKTHRVNEILNAFEECIIKFGLHGSTLERIANHARVKRTAIRHYVGNRETLVHALTKRTMTKFDHDTDRLFDTLPAHARVETLINILFSPTWATDPKQVLIFQALVTTTEEYPKLKSRLRAWVDDFTNRIAEEIHSEYASSTKKKCWMVASTIVGLYFNIDALSPLGLSIRYRISAIEAVEQLLTTLQKG